MSTARAGTPGATRVCPHCKAVVLETAAVCPGCRHHLRFNATDAQLAAAEAYSAFNIEGTIAHKQAGEHCEYCIVLDIRNERGEQIMRQVVGVGALHPGELRRLNLAVEMLPVRAAVAPKNEQPAARDPRRAAVPSAPVRPVAASPTIASPTATAPSRAPAAPALVPQGPAAKPAPAPATPAASSASKGSAPAGATGRPAGERAAEESTSQLRLFRKP